MSVPSADVEAVARHIALEQSLEAPEDLVRTRGVEALVGRIEAIEPVAAAPPGAAAFVARISYPAELCSGQLPQLLNLVGGNISFHPRVRVADLELPPSVLARFPGPRHGISGLRHRLGVEGRPLLCTALKPRGVDSREIARMAGEFARGGGDIVKDDHNLVETSLDAFAERVRRCQDAVHEANAATGRAALYFPYMSWASEDLDRALELLACADVEGILIAPMLMGLDVTRRIGRETGLLLMSHPSFSGGCYVGETHGFDHGVYLGTIMRLVGVDASIFTNSGGRFRFPRETCIEISRRLRAPLGGLKPVFPVPAGGMTFENIAPMAGDFGTDTIMLIGGALLGHSDDLCRSTELCLRRIEEQFAAPR